MEKSEQINEIAAALSKAQSEMKGAKKDSDNPFFKSGYADLASVWDSIREPLTKNGLAVVQSADPIEGGVLITTLLTHSSGQWLSGSLKIPVTKMDAQGVGSAMSYGRRYGLAAITGAYQVDDDGEAAHGRSKFQSRAAEGLPSTLSDEVVKKPLPPPSRLAATPVSRGIKDGF